MTYNPNCEVVKKDSLFIYIHVLCKKSSGAIFIFFLRMEKGKAVWLNLMDYKVNLCCIWLPLELISLVFYPKPWYASPTQIAFQFSWSIFIKIVWNKSTLKIVTYFNIFMQKCLIIFKSQTVMNSLEILSTFFQECFEVALFIFCLDACDSAVFICDGIIFV